MTADDALCDGVRILLKEAASFMPAKGLGVIQRDGAEHCRFTYIDEEFGATGYRSRLENIPQSVRPGDVADGPTRIDLDAAHLGVVETRILHTGFHESVAAAVVSLRQPAARYAIAQTIPDLDEPATLLVVAGEPCAVTAIERDGIDRLVRKTADLLRRTESAGEQQALFRRLEAVARMVPALFRVLDVREIFDQISTMAKDVLRHDFAIVGLYTEEASRLVLYVQTADQPLEFRSGPMPFPKVQTDDWLYRIVDDLALNPLERDADSVKSGGRSSIRVAIRSADAVLGALNFTSRDPLPYDATDLVVCRRIADYVALALSHHRLAEEARLHERLRARAANLELLDELLGKLGDGDDLRDVLARLSSLAAKVLIHDALIEVPLAQDASDWESDLVDDLAVEKTEANAALVAEGFRSVLRVPVRLDGRIVTAVAFVARAPSSFNPEDVIVARRIADRFALSLSRARGREATRRADEATARASNLEVRVRALIDELDSRTGVRGMVGESAPWRQVLIQSTQVASTETTVLLLGESGTGKELVARFLHRASARGGGAFIALNCAALPEHLLEAELFGYERGAFTGATQSKPGQLEQAAGGTLFLDEVAEMSPSAQAKFLRVLQEREFQRLGGTRVLRTDARIVAATNRDLARALANGQFREDLFYRLNVFPIRLPPLRERREDIPTLCEAFLADIARGLGRPPAGVSRDARKVLTEYHWPGNVRELRNILERAAILCEGGLITAEHLALGPPATPPLPSASLPPVTSASDLQSLERVMVERALQNARFNKSKAAKALGLTRQQLYVRMRRYGLE